MIIDVPYSLQLKSINVQDKVIQYMVRKINKRNKDELKIFMNFTEHAGFYGKGQHINGVWEYGRKGKHSEETHFEMFTYDEAIKFLMGIREGMEM